jgi:hypothetical protein
LIGGEIAFDHLLVQPTQKCRLRQIETPAAASKPPAPPTTGVKP